ncbi:hypothetical protein PFISCL1PPCAC_9529, partial [Pristionchus fissidentatus]
PKVVAATDPAAASDAFPADASEAVGSREAASSEEVAADLEPLRKLIPGAVKKQILVQAPCPRCYKMIDTLNEARAHIDEGMCEQIGDYACDICGKRLASKWTLKKHLERHAERMRCFVCTTRFDSVGELRDHNLISGHMFRAGEGVGGAPDIAEMRKVRRKEQKEAMKRKETESNLKTVNLEKNADGTVGPPAAKK